MAVSPATGLCLIGMLILTAEGLKPFNSDHSWTQPCDAEGENSGSASKPMTLHSAVDRLLKLSTKATNEARALSKKYRSVKSPYSSIYNLLNTYHTLGFPEVVSPDNAFAASVREISQTLQQNYDTLSGIAVFLEQLCMDELVYDHTEYWNDVKALEETVYAMLCTIDKANVLKRNHRYTSREIVSENIRLVTPKVRQLRNYIIVKDATAVLSSLKLQYKVMKSAEGITTTPAS